MATVELMEQTGERTLHPFFTNSLVPQSNELVSQRQEPDSLSESKPNNAESSHGTENNAASHCSAVEDQPGRKRRAPVTKRGTSAQRGLMAAFAGKTGETTNGGNAGPLVRPPAEAATSLDVDPNHSRRKRRKTASPEAELHSAAVEEKPHEPPGASGGLSWHEQLEAQDNKSHGHDQAPISSASEQDLTLEQTDNPTGPGVDPPIFETMPLSSMAAPEKTLLEQHSPAENIRDLRASKRQEYGEIEQRLQTPSPAEGAPKKMLRLNARGKLGSPPMKNEKNPRMAGSGGDKKKARDKKRARELVAVLRYGLNSSDRRQMGQQIDDILSGRVQLSKPQNCIEVPIEAVESKQMSKPTHPFFLGKTTPDQGGKVISNQNQSTEKFRSLRKTAITPGKLKAEAMADRDPEALSAPGPIFGSSRPNGLQKHSGAKDAAWPWQGISHVRPLSGKQDDAAALTQIPMLDGESERRKLKHVAIQVPVAENMLTELARQLFENSQSPNVNPLRRPERLLTTGEDLQELLKQRLSDAGRLQHEPFLTLFENIKNTLSPFDLFKCEVQTWTQKYAPQRADQVLQTGKEVSILHDWLKALTIRATSSGLQPAEKAEVSKKRPRKRQRRGSDLADFVVSEDDSGSFYELTDPEDNFLCESAPSLVTKKSLVRARSSETTKLANVVLLSGPNGCGKTAAVHAVARELGFQVFEINSGSRRSGKDIMDRIGDMTENHLVRQAVARQLDLPTSETTQANEPDATQEDIHSGRQSTMASFFKAGSKKSKTKGPKPSKQPEMQPKSAPANKRNQKQSLILFEEVDVLFEEDQGFWGTIKALAMHSKRPIILTCTDENLVRLEEEFLHAILRFSPPPTDLATDYLLLLAASEGHILHRVAVESLYASKCYDLRASIAELDFWCQMAVGDVKGGLAWIFQRWPPGSDLDEHGRRVRVGSRDTYQQGIGWTTYDLHCDRGHIGFDPQQEICKQASYEWGLDPHEISRRWPTTSERPSHDPSPANVSKQSHLRKLSEQESHLDLMSCADVLCGGISNLDGSPQMHTNLNTSLPAISEKSLQSFTEGYSVLQTEPLEEFAQPRLDLAATLSLKSSIPVAEVDSASAEAITGAILRATRDKLHQPWTAAGFVSALDPLSNMSSSSLSSSSGPPISCIDRPISVIAADVAPYVRSIVAFDMRLEAERSRLNTLLSGHSRGKLRKTRAARSALEGGNRETTRRENWFVGPAALDQQAVMRTGGETWAGMGVKELGEGESDFSGAGSMSASVDTAEEIE